MTAVLQPLLFLVSLVAVAAASPRQASYDAELRAEAMDIWLKGFIGQGVRVGLFDAGFCGKHLNVRAPKNYTNWTDEPDEEDYDGHGGAAAGIIASLAPNCPGLAPEVDLYIFKIWTNGKKNKVGWLKSAVDYALTLNLDFVNFAIGDRGNLPDSEAFAVQAQRLLSAGIAVIAPVGNMVRTEDCGPPELPARLFGVFSVGAARHEDPSRDKKTMQAPFSLRECVEEYGDIEGRTPNAEYPFVLGPGDRIPVAYNHDICAYRSGTSISSAFVTGAAALLYSAAKQQGKTHITPTKVMYALGLSGGGNTTDDTDDATRFNLRSAYKILELA